MIQYKKLKIKRGNQVIGYLYFQEDELLTIEKFRLFLASKNINSDITDAEIQAIIDNQVVEGDADDCCTDPYPVSPTINYVVEDTDTIIFTVTNYNSNQEYIIKVYDSTELLSTITYTEPLGIDLDPGIYRFEIETSTCSGKVIRDYSVELGNITVTLNLHGNLESSLITSSLMNTVIQSFVGDSVNIDSNIINQLDHLWKVNSILINGNETINNEVYNITKSNTDNVLTNISFIIDNIQQSVIVDIYSNYNTIEWCTSEKCVECIYDGPINLPPIANDNSYSVKYNETLTVEAPGILSNDIDPENDSLTVSIVQGVSNGTLNNTGNGGFIYYPNTNFSGIDSFTYKVFDSNNQEDTATVTIEVRPRENCGFSTLVIGTQPNEVLDIITLVPAAIAFTTTGLYEIRCDTTYPCRVIVNDRVTGEVLLNEVTEGEYRPNTGRYFDTLQFNKLTSNHFTIRYISSVQGPGEFRFQPLKVCEEV